MPLVCNQMTTDQCYAKEVKEERARTSAGHTEEKWTGIVTRTSKEVAAG